MTFTLNRRSLLVGAAAMALTLPNLPTASAVGPRTVFSYYYPWYVGSPSYAHWGASNPTQTVYYPKLGAYTSGASSTLTNHCAWAKTAGIDCFVSSWWGRGDTTDANLGPLLDAAAAVGLKVALHIEPYTGRTAASVRADIQYLIDTFGNHPGLMRMSRTSYFGPSTANRPVVFVFATPISDAGWIPMVDALRGTPYDCLLMCTMDDSMMGTASGAQQMAVWSHCDGLYNFGMYDYTNGTPLPYSNSSFLCVPAITPGWNATRVRPGEAITSRSNGALYDRIWNAVINAHQYDAVGVCSFNEWHEGSQIEPAQAHVGYQDYNHAYGLTGTSAQLAYINRTASWTSSYKAS